jgi:hypothetical protein
MNSASSACSSPQALVAHGKAAEAADLLAVGAGVEEVFGPRLGHPRLERRTARSWSTRFSLCSSGQVEELTLGLGDLQVPLAG